jgi:hypothetical protein
VLFLFTFFTQFIGGLYSAYGTELPPFFELLSRIAFAWLLWWWLREDSKRTAVTWPLDLGFFLFVGWILIIPYHLFKTRGLKGFFGILWFIGILLAAWVAATFVAVLLWFSR